MLLIDQAATQHTPGPWTAQVFEPTAEQGMVVYICTADEEEGSGGSLLEGNLVLESDAVNRANARLVAAAPELLKAVESLLLYDERLHPADVARLQAAVEKATGR